MKNIELLPFEHASSFRRIAAVAWDPPQNSSIYGSIQIRAERLLAWLEAERARTGEHLTITHAVARAVAITFDRHRDINCLVRMGRLYLRKDVDVFVQVALPSKDRVGATDLSGVVVRQADGKDIQAIAAEIRSGAARIRAGEDKDFQTTKGQAFSFPPWLFRIALRFIVLLQYVFNISGRSLGAPRDPFGSVMVTSLGMMGVNFGFAPFFPLAACPMVLLVGAVEDGVVAEEGQPVVRKVLRLCATMDHRVIDGVHAAILAREISALLENPEQLELS